MFEFFVMIKHYWLTKIAYTKSAQMAAMNR